MAALALAFLPLLVQAFAFPRTGPALAALPFSTTEHRDWTVQSSVQELNNSAAYIKFAIPFAGARQDDDEYLFELRVLPSKEPCSLTHLELNNRVLRQQWTGSSIEASDSLPVQTSHDSHYESLAITWQASCLDTSPHRLQVLTLLVDAGLKETGPSPEIAGFTISYNQVHPELVLFSPSPDLNAHRPNPQNWLNPSPFDRLPLAVLPVGDRAHGVSSIEEEIEKLNILQNHYSPTSLDDPLVSGQTRIVKALFRQQLKQAKESLNACDGVDCVLRTALTEAKAAFKLACLRFRHHSPFDNLANCPGQKVGHSYVLPNDPHQPVLAIVEKTYIENCDQYRPDLQDPQAHIDASLYDSSQEESEFTADVYNDELSDHSYQSYEDQLQWTPLDEDDTSHKVLIVLGIIASCLCLTCIIAALRHRCCSPRARADRLARREERRTRRQYRRLARRHAWKDWWDRHCFLKRSRCTSDYEEKRALIVVQEDVLEGVMQREIRSLTNSHGQARNDISAAEQGRISGPSEEDFAPISRSNSLPGYRSRTSSGRPPSYNELDENSSSVVADGFINYTPSPTEGTADGTDITPNSSVVEISPRHSSETLRTQYSMV